jgi:8-oxo-dGTP diphosphatase
MNNIEKALKTLKKDPDRNISLINLIENNFYEDFIAYGNAVILKRKTLRKCFIAGDNDEDIMRVLDIAYNKQFFSGDYKRFSSVDYRIVPIVKSRFDVNMGNCGDKLFLSDDVSLPKPDRQAQPITIDEAGIINSYWEHKNQVELEYIKQCISHGKGFILYHKDEPVSWAMTHYDGSLGFLHVREEYRRQGYGRDVMIPLIKEMRRLGKRIFTHIVGYNDASSGLAEKLGYKSLYRICWLSLSIKD